MSYQPFVNVVCEGDVISGAPVGNRTILSKNQVLFQNNTATQAGMSGSEDRITFEGTSGGTCLLSGVSDPVDPQDVATKNYIDTEISGVGVKWKTSCAATDTGSNVSLPATITIDGVTLVAGERALLKNQSAALENGVYVVNGSSQLERATDMATGDNVADFAFYIEEGTAGTGSAYIVTNNFPDDVVDTDVLVFGQFAGDPTVPGGVSGALQYNNAGVFAGINTLTTDGTDITLNGGNLNIQDTDELQIGDSSDVIISHDGTDSYITSKTGDLVIDNTNATGSSIVRLGTDTAATDFQVQNNSLSSSFSVTGAGVVSIGSTFSSDGTDVTLNGGDMNIQDSDELQFGDAADLTLTHDATNSVITSNTGDLIIDNTNATGSSIVRLGTDTAATDFQVQNNSLSSSFSVTGAGVVSIGSTFSSDGTDLTLNGGNLNLLRNDELRFGNSLEMALGNDGSTSALACASGDLLIINVDATNDLLLRLGSTDANTQFEVQDSSGSDNLIITGAGLASFSNTTDATSPTAAALITAGGVGVSKSMYVGGDKVEVHFSGTGTDGVGFQFIQTSGNPGYVISPSNVSGNYSSVSAYNVSNATSTSRYFTQIFTGTSFGTRNYNGASGFTPAADLTSDLGGSSLQWKETYSGGVTLAKSTVTQVTSTTTSVTINARQGVIYTYATPTYTAGTTTSFTVTNSLVASTSIILLNVAPVSGSTAAFTNLNGTPGSGSFSINVCNVTASDFTAQLAIHFVVL